MFSGDTMPTSWPSSTTITDFGFVPLMMPSQACSNLSWGEETVTSVSTMSPMGVSGG